MNQLLRKRGVEVSYCDPHFPVARPGRRNTPDLRSVPLTPEEFDEWHRCLELPLKVEYGRKPVAFCNHEGVWWVIYEDTDESEVIAGFEKCFQG